MSIHSIRDVANIQYGGFYIPVASWLYIYYQTQSQLAFYSLPIIILGATLTHGIMHSIFGPKGPQTHPKKNLAVVGYFLALFYTKEPGGTPDTIDEFHQRLCDAFTIRRSIRFLLFSIIAVAYTLLMFYSIIPLYELSVGGGNLIASVLLVTQTVFIVQGVMMNRFANVLPPDEAEWVWVPEYRRLYVVYSEEEYEESEYRDPPLIFADLQEWMNDFRDDFSIKNNHEGEEHIKRDS